MPTFATRTFAAALLVAACLSGTPRTAVAADETCVQCKHADCLRGTIKRKLAMAEGYDALAAKYGVGWKKADGKPAMEWDMSTFTTDLARAEGYDRLRTQQDGLTRDEETLSERVGAPAGCELGDAEDPSTNNETCETTGLVSAMAQSPCKQIGDLLARHEGVHQATCEARKPTSKVRLIDPVTQRYIREIPKRMITAAGRATEEARAYRMEAAALEPLLKQANEKCEITFKGVKTSCTIPSPAGSMSMGQEITGKACGDPVTANWTINVVNWVRAPYIGEQRTVDPPFDNDCVAKGSAEERRREAIYRAGPGKGWMCVYEDKPAPQIHIRYFRLPQCAAPTEQTYTVPAIRGECDEDTPPSPQPPTVPDRPNS